MEYFVCLIVFAFSIYRDISKNIAAIRTFQQNRKMKCTSLAIRATMVFKTRGVNNIRQKMLDMGKLKLQSMGSRSDSTISKDETKCDVAEMTDDEREYDLTKHGTHPLWYDEAVPQ